MMRPVRLRVDPIACTGHGICVELLPELIYLDDWGYPILNDRPVPEHLLDVAKRTVAACPALALRLDRDEGPLVAQSAVRSTPSHARRAS